ncbi:GTPase-activating protein [Acrasis kona]|uniref:GTPase-activating protein n=1 Tax=Acrasis kona TaxID=1008807 RepID=A0AAW2ZGV4_9EUKA
MNSHLSKMSSRALLFVRRPITRSYTTATNTTQTTSPKVNVVESTNPNTTVSDIKVEVVPEPDVINPNPGVVSPADIRVGSVLNKNEGVKVVDVKVQPPKPSVAPVAPAKKTENDLKDPITFKQFLLYLLAGASISTFAYFKLHYQIIDENAELIKKITDAGLARSAEETANHKKLLQKIEDEDILRRRNIARQIKMAEQEKKFLQRAKRDIARAWNSVFVMMGLSMEMNDEQIQQREQQLIEARIQDEIKAVYGVNNAKIIHVETH